MQNFKNILKAGDNMETFLILILLTLWLVVAAFCGVAGFYLGRRCKPKQEEKVIAEPKEPTEEEKKKAIRQQKELENMMFYDGSEQPDIVV